MHIAIVGNIGAGKTTLTELLAKQFGWEPQFEAVDNNPYLEDFYGDMKRWSFNLQIYFLNSRFQQIIELQKEIKALFRIVPFMKTLIFLQKTCTIWAWWAVAIIENYRAIFDNITSFIKAPDLLIYLKASVPTLVNNIQRRGRDYESGIRLDYLSKLNEKYKKWIDGYKEGKLLILDKDKLDFANNPEDLGIVMQSIEREINGLF